jgi:hydroxyacyl-ACP dehydratase HTD2-like protein with hotdog domain
VTQPEYTQPGPDLRAHPTWAVRYHGRRPYPERLPSELDFRRGMDAGKDVEFGVPIRPGDAITVRSTLHDVYEKTGRSGSMTFVVLRVTLTNQRGERVAVVDNRFMHR